MHRTAMHSADRGIRRHKRDDADDEPVPAPPAGACAPARAVVGHRLLDGRDVGAAPVPFLSGPFSLEPWVDAPLLLAAALYAAGVARLWHHAGVGRGVTRMQAACFVAGWLSIGIALVSPLDALGSQLFSAHMVQHEILMLVTAPLMVLARPLA